MIDANFLMIQLVIYFGKFCLQEFYQGFRFREGNAGISHHLFNYEDTNQYWIWPHVQDEWENGRNQSNIAG